MPKWIKRLMQYPSAVLIARLKRHYETSIYECREYQVLFDEAMAAWMRKKRLNEYEHEVLCRAYAGEIKFCGVGMCRCGRNCLGDIFDESV